MTWQARPLPRPDLSDVPERLWTPGKAEPAREAELYERMLRGEASLSRAIAALEIIDVISADLLPRERDLIRSAVKTGLGR